VRDALRTHLRRLRGFAREAKSLSDLSRAANRIVRRTDFTSCPSPVLLVYGFLGTRRSFELLEARLRRDGHGVFTINLGGLADAFNTRTIDETAEHVAAKVERLYRRYDLGPLTVIGHSKGGLIGRYYVKRLGGEKRVRTLVTLGTPHNGTPTAYLGAPFPVFRSLRQMTPMCPFIRRLKLGPWPDSVYFASIHSKADRVTPFPVALLETGGKPNLVNVEVDAAHGEFLSRKRVYDAIREQLRAGEAWAARRAAEVVVPLPRRA
jgi:pimeloyl-ACP methyl ester carboxylesterase